MSTPSYAAEKPWQRFKSTRPGLLIVFALALISVASEQLVPRYRRNLV
jgi:hypothetical protein